MVDGFNNASSLQKNKTKGKKQSVASSRQAGFDNEALKKLMQVYY
jgi:hypothetical protein